ncbi:MAG: hypothetical protein R3C11_13980 [Planctomycetaceae bacterium]
MTTRESNNENSSIWGLVTWFPEQAPSGCHPDDIEITTELSPYCKVFELVSKNEDYLTVRYQETHIRISPECFKRINAPGKSFGSLVSIKSSNGSIHSGTITDIIWHWKNNEPFFLLTIDGKRKSKRYYESDFI